MPRPSRLGLALAATVAASSLFVGGGLASAEPGPNSPECAAAKTKETTAKTAADAPGADAAAKSAYEQAQQATKDACTAKATTTTTTTTSKAPDQNKPPRDEGGRPPNGGNGRPDNGGDDRNGDGRDDDDQNGPAGDDKDCDDFMSQPEAQKYYDEVGSDDNPDPSRLDRDNDGKACESLKDVDGDRSKLPAKIDVNVVIVQSDDDDSEAKVSGSQVKDVPEGSVDTGSVQ